MDRLDETEVILDQFVHKLVDEKGLENLEDSVRQELEGILREELEQTIFAEIVAALSADQQGEFERLLESEATPEQSQQFLQRAIPDYGDFIAGVLLKFRRIYLG